MGKLFRIRHVDNHELEDKQLGCVWGLVHALDYHRWHSKGRKMTARRKYEGQKQSKSHGSPKQNLLESGEVEKHSDDQERVDQSNKSPRSTKKRSLKARIKALIAEETSRNVDNNEQHKSGLSVPSRLNRTYSIHHLESSDDGLHKIVTEWQNPIIFFPENDDDKENEVEKDADFFEAFKVDKELFAKTTEDSNKSARLGKSKSFPAANLLQRKPSKLEQKKNETWSFPRSDIIQTGDVTISRGRDEYSVRKSTKTHLRSSSLNELVDKYASLFASSDSAEVKLRPSRSLKSINEYGHAQTYFRRIRSLSLSHVDYYYPDKKSGVVVNDLSADGSNTMLEENEATNGENKPVDTHNHMQTIEDEFEAHELILGESDLREDQVTNITEIIPTKLPEESDFGQDEPRKENCSDLDYVRHILEKSGIAKNALDITWHSSGQQLSPDLFEEIEDEWPHERSEFNGWPDFYGCWHHRLLFDVVNDVLLQIYNNSFPYYPKALSSSCHVRPVPDGSHFIEQVSTSVGALVNFKPEEKESLDSIVAYNLANDYSWMNLQSESENVALDLEDMILDELLEEIMLT